MPSKNRLETINKTLRPYGVQCYTWSPGDGVTRYRFSRDLDSDYHACRVVVTVLGAGQADLVAGVWMQAYHAGRHSGLLEHAYPDRKED